MQKYIWTVWPNIFNDIYKNIESTLLKTQIWKAIKKLKTNSYAIHSFPSQIPHWIFIVEEKQNLI